MDNARVVIIEDEPDIRLLTSLRLRRDGHEVVAEAATTVDGLATVKALKEGSFSADVVLLDGNLEPGDTSGNSAREIRSAMTAAGLDHIYVLGYSVFSLVEKYHIPDVIDTRKAEEAVFTTINELPRRR